MLYNNEDQAIMVAKNLNSKNEPDIFKPLREKLEFNPPAKGGMFSIEQRAKVKGLQA